MSGLSEAVSVVPLPGLLEPLRMTHVGAEALHLSRCESEGLVHVGADDVVHFQVVQPGEYALLRDLHYAGDHPESERAVALQCGSEEPPHEVQYLALAWLAVRLVHRRIVFVDEGHDLPAVLRLQDAHEVVQGADKHPAAGGEVRDSLRYLEAEPRQSLPIPGLRRLPRVWPS